MGNGAAKVTFTERDLSFFIQAVTQGRNCVQLTSRRGPVNVPKLIGSMKQYREVFGVAIASSNSDEVIQRALDRGAVLYVNRVVHYTDPGDASTITGVKATYTFEDSATDPALTLTAVDEGSWGNEIEVTITASPIDAAYFDLTISFPEQDELSETYTYLTMVDSDERYAIKIINENSKLVTAEDEGNLNPDPIAATNLATGDDGLTGLDDDDWIGSSVAGTGLHAFNDIDDAFGLATIETTSPAVATAGIAYCEAREDMVYYIEGPASVDSADEAVDYRLGDGIWSHAAFNSSYGAMYFGRPKVRSAKTNSIIDISTVGDVFGVHAYSDKKAEVWFAPAGLQRGRVPNTLGVHYNVGTPGRASELDELSNNQINSIVDFSEDGTVIWDEQTLQRTPSALQSLHIRRLLIYMRKALLKINRIWLFEPNDPVTWRRVYNLIDPWMKDLLDRRAFYEYLIQCDQDAKNINDAILNTPERIDRQEFVCRIFIKPTRIIKYLGIEAVITKTSANFKELLDIRL